MAFFCFSVALEQDSPTEMWIEEASPTDIWIEVESLSEILIEEASLTEIWIVGRLRTQIQKRNILDQCYYTTFLQLEQLISF